MIALLRMSCYNPGMLKFVNITLLLLLATPGWAFGSVSYACRMSGEVSRTCCCAPEVVATCDVMTASSSCCDVSVTKPVATGVTSRPITPVPEDNPQLAWRASASMVLQFLPKMPEAFSAAKRFNATSAPPPLILLIQSIRC